MKQPVFRFLFLTITVFVSAGLAACADGAGTDTPQEPLAEIEAYLAGQTGGASEDDPVRLVITMDLGVMEYENSGWKKLLKVIENAGKYVELDLSACKTDDSLFNPGNGFDPGKDKIVAITLPDTAKSIEAGEGTLRLFSSLYSISGAGVTSIGLQAFYRFDTLKSVSFPVLTSIGESAFYRCLSLESVNLPAATIIGDRAFHRCRSLKNVSLPVAVNIGVQAFDSCAGLESLSLPSATSVGD
jgi:hypothetical protein